VSVLVLYPHGLGDCILLTPALRAYYETNKKKCHIATLERFKDAKFFDECPYVDKIFYTKDAWNDYPDSRIGFQSLYEEWKEYAVQSGFEGFVMPMHSVPQSKILINAYGLGIKKLSDPRPEIFTTEEDKEIAYKIIKDLVGENDFGFVQTKAGHELKSLPENYGRKWILENTDLKNIIEIGKEIDGYAYNINVQFEILRRAAAVCLPDSVFYHACNAMNKPIDFVYFARGGEVYHRVKPLHKVEENVAFSL
jgi:hypothetical protein